MIQWRTEAIKYCYECGDDNGNLLMLQKAEGLYDILLNELKGSLDEEVTLKDLIVRKIGLNLDCAFFTLRTPKRFDLPEQPFWFEKLTKFLNEDRVKNYGVIEIFQKAVYDFRIIIQDHAGINFMKHFITQVETYEEKLKYRLYINSLMISQQIEKHRWVLKEDGFNQDD